MRLQIESLHFEAGKKLMGLVRKRFEHLEKRYDRIHHCVVILRKDKNDVQKNFYVEAKMEVPGKMLFAEDRAETFETAISKVIHDLERQLRRCKEKLEERR